MHDGEQQRLDDSAPAIVRCAAVLVVSYSGGDASHLGIGACLRVLDRLPGHYIVELASLDRRHPMRSRRVEAWIAGLEKSDGRLLLKTTMVRSEVSSINEYTALFDKAYLPYRPRLIASRLINLCKNIANSKLEKLKLFESSNGTLFRDLKEGIVSISDTYAGQRIVLARLRTTPFADAINAETGTLAKDAASFDLSVTIVDPASGKVCVENKEDSENYEKHLRNPVCANGDRIIKKSSQKGIPFDLFAQNEKGILSAKLALFEYNYCNRRGNEIIESMKSLVRAIDLANHSTRSVDLELEIRRWLA